ncbi:Rib/alpha-like domain-containing protein [Enterococcus faecalis]|uniref:Rib/alpha-like domain-containing protein n=1 Tax=Enterococcus faecalis TaxID=1351 RepID=UPI003F496F6B
MTTELNKEPDASEGIKNKKDLPKDAKYTWKEKVDISTAGNKKGTVVVTYSDGSSDEVEVDVTIYRRQSDCLLLLLKLLLYLLYHLDTLLQ